MIVRRDEPGAPVGARRGEIQARHGPVVFAPELIALLAPESRRGAYLEDV
jgi:hypothetical protein